jgi:hypothetical protein
MRQRLDGCRSPLFLESTMRSGLVVVLLGVPALLAAQGEPPLARGTRVRVRTLTEAGVLDRGFDGNVERISGDTLVVHPRWGSSQTFLAGPGNQLFVFTGRHSAALQGTVIGGTAGLLVGGLVAAFAGDVCTDADALCTSRRPIAVKAGVLLGTTGAVTGLLVGIFASYEKWAPSRAYWGVHPAVSIGAGQLSCGLSISF